MFCWLMWDIGFTDVLLPFMISCVVIVLLGFTVAALCEYFSSRRKDAMNLRRVARHLIEGVLLAVFIIIICVVILVAGGFGNSSDRGYVNSDPPVIYVLSI